MNTAQRQILSDRINALTFEINDLQDTYDRQVISQQKRAQRLESLKRDKAELEEGVDW